MSIARAQEHLSAAERLLRTGRLAAGPGTYMHGIFDDAGVAVFRAREELRGRRASGVRLADIGREYRECISAQAKVTVAP